MLKKKPLVSVVIPSYNHRPYIVECITSVLKQSYRPLELIIIDDGSQDGSVETIARMLASPEVKKSDVTISFFKQQNIGAHHTINRGLTKARGEYLTILNSDDYYLPKRIEILVNTIKKKKSELIFSLVKHVDPKNRTVSGEHVMKKWYDDSLAKDHFPSMGFRLLMSNIVVTTGNLFFSRNLFKQLKGFRNFQIMHDYDFILRALYYTEPVLVNQTLLAYRVHDNNTCTQLGHLAHKEGPTMAFDFFKDNILRAHPKNPNAPCKSYWKDEFVSFWENENSWLRGWMGGSVPTEFL